MSSLGLKVKVGVSVNIFKIPPNLNWDYIDTGMSIRVVLSG